MRYLGLSTIVVAIIATCIFYNAQADSPDKEKKMLKPTYTNVDVEIKYDWNGAEYFKDVNVWDKTQNEKPHLVISHKDRGCCEILILEGVRVTIYDHNTGKTLNVYSTRK